VASAPAAQTEVTRSSRPMRMTQQQRRSCACIPPLSLDDLCRTASTLPAALPAGNLVKCYISLASKRKWPRQPFFVAVHSLLLERSCRLRRSALRSLTEGKQTCRDRQDTRSHCAALAARARRRGDSHASWSQGGSRMRKSRTCCSVRVACDETHVPTATRREFIAGLRRACV
jgi:hypothetical protein